MWYLFRAFFGLSEYAGKRSICFCVLRHGREKESILTGAKGEACHFDHRFG